MSSTFGVLFSTVKGDSSFRVPSAMVQSRGNSALPGAGVLLTCRELVNVGVHKTIDLILHEEQIPHSFVLNLMAEGLVIELLAESPKWLTSKE